MRAAARAALLFSLLAPAAAAGQLRRAPAIPYAPDAAGRLLIGVGAGYAAEAEFPLSGLTGDLARLGALSIRYSPAPGTTLYVEGDAVRVLSIEARRAPTVELHPDVDDGTTHDAGDVRLGTLVRLAGAPRGLSGGLHLEVTLPSSDERKGIGTNTTDVAGSVFGSWARGPWRLTGDLGVAVLEAPVDGFVQNDVVVYAAELLYRPTATPASLSVAAVGRASTRGRVPLGTEDLGEARLGGELIAGPWRLDADVAVGYTEVSPEWSLEAGVARLVAF